MIVNLLNAKVVTFISERTILKVELNCVTFVKIDALLSLEMVRTYLPLKNVQPSSQLVQWSSDVNERKINVQALLSTTQM